MQSSFARRVPSSYLMKNNWQLYCALTDATSEGPMLAVLRNGGRSEIDTS